MTRRILTGLTIDKIAAVDRPCQEHATSDIMKRAESYDDFCKRKFSAQQREEATASGHAMPGGRYPINDVEDLHNAIHAIGRGSGSHAAIRAHIVSRAKALGATSSLPEEWGVSKADPGITTEESIMLKELQKALGLPETATEADVTKAVIKLAVDENKELVAKLAAAEVLAKMSDKHKAYAANLSGDAKDKFMAMDNDARDAACAKVAPDIEKALRDGDAFKTPEGILITKAKVGDEIFYAMKASNDRITTMAADLAKSKDDVALADFAKRATDVGFGAEFGPNLRKAYGGDGAAQVEVEKRIKGLQEQVTAGALFKNFGSNSPDPASAEAELMIKVEEVKKANPKLKAAQAYSKAYTDPANADIVKRMKEEASA